jgi:hypothetical protein
MAAIIPETRDRAWNEICDLGLQTYVADLDAQSFCIIPPEIANPNGLAEGMLEALLDIAEQRNGERPDLETGATHANQPNMLFGAKNDRFARDELKDQTPAVQAAHPEAADSPFGDRMHSIFFEDEVFADALMNPPLLAMVTYLLGYSAVLSNMGCWMKGPNKSNFPLHTDAGGMPSPLPALGYTAQCTYLLTDFDRENGATAIVPGSHKWCRNPKGDERILLPYEQGGKEQATACDAPAGSLVIWHGNAWHGAFNRTAPGVRVSVTVYFCRPFMRPLEDFIGRVPQEMIDKYGPRLAMVLQQGCVPGYSTQGDRVSSTARAEQFISAYEDVSGGGLRDKDDPFH